MVLFRDLPESATVWIGRYAFKEQSCRPCAQGPIDDVAVPRNPADVCRAEVNLARLVLKDIDKGVSRPDHVAAARMHHALRFARATTGIQDKQEVLCLHFYGGERFGVVRQSLVVPNVAACHHVHGLLRSLVNHHRMHFRTGKQGHVDNALEGNRFSAPKRTVAGNEGSRLGIENTVGDALRRKSPKDDRMHRSQTRAGQNSYRELGNHAHVDANAVAFLDAARR